MKEKQQEAIENYINAYNHFDIEGMTADLDENIVFKNLSNGEIDLKTEGLAAFKKQANTAKQYFKQRKQTIEKWIFNDKKISIHIDYEAILNIDLPNGLKKGDTLKLKGKSSFEFDQGKIISITDES